MARVDIKQRLATAVVFTLIALTILLAWSPTWDLVADGTTVINSTWWGRYLLVLIPLVWAWVAFSAGTRRARVVGLIGSLILFLACASLLWYHFNVLGWWQPCLWQGDC